MIRKLIVIILFLFASNAIFAANNKLNQIQSQIDNLKNVLTQDQSKQAQLLQQLQSTEINIGILSSQLQKIHNKYQQQQALMNDLNQQGQNDQTQLSQQQDNMAAQLRALYLLGHEQYLKVLFNQQDPNQMGRLMMYYHYISQQQLQLIDQYNQTLKQISATKLAIEQQSKKLSLLQQQQQSEQSQLQNTKNNRQQLLHNINTHINNGNQQLKTLIANKTALERVITQLNSQSTYASTTTLISHHGKLPWPTKGKITAHFGSPIEQSQLSWNGVLIQAPEGQPVYAVSPGSVVFANWMAGYGLLLIIDHGNGYMTIYGRNDSLYKKVGDQVKKGELIATVGNSGGYNTPALYFAIRDNGKPLNPEQLCG